MIQFEYAVLSFMFGLFAGMLLLWRARQRMKIWIRLNMPEPVMGYEVRATSGASLGVFDDLRGARILQKRQHHSGRESCMIVRQEIKKRGVL